MGNETRTRMLKALTPDQAGIQLPVTPIFKDKNLSKSLLMILWVSNPTKGASINKITLRYTSTYQILAKNNI